MDNELVGKVMRTTILNAFMSERNPLYSVNRTLNALDNVGDRCQKASTKQSQMKELAAYVVAEIKGDTPAESDDTSTKEDVFTQFMKDQQVTNKAILAKLNSK